MSESCPFAPARATRRGGNVPNFIRLTTLAAHHYPNGEQNYPGAYPPASYPPNVNPPGAYPGYGCPRPQPNSLAVAALVLSLFGLTSCITAPVWAILGHVAQKQIRETGESGEGLAKAAIIVGWILTGLATLLIVFSVVVLVPVATEPASTG